MPTLLMIIDQKCQSVIILWVSTVKNMKIFIVIHDAA